MDFYSLCAELKVCGALSFKLHEMFNLCSTIQMQIKLHAPYYRKLFIWLTEGCFGHMLEGALRV